MNCFAAALAIGASTKTGLVSAAIIIAASFGVFPAGMTIIDWAAGASLWPPYSSREIRISLSRW